MHKNKQAWFFKFNKNVYVTLRGLLSPGYRTENKKFSTENQQNDKLTKRLSGKLSGAP